MDTGIVKPFNDEHTIHIAELRCLKRGTKHFIEILFTTNPVV